MNFYEWLCKQTYRDDPVGDLACDTKRLKDHPTSNEFSDWYSFLYSKNACGEAFKALSVAYNEYTGDKQGSIS